MQSLEDFRKRFPMYSDMSDEELARAIHKKWYSDLPFEDVAQRLGLPPAPPPIGWGDTAIDAVQSAGTGLVQGLTGLAGTVGDLREGAGALAGWTAGKFGASPETQQMMRNAGENAMMLPTLGASYFAPTSDQVQGWVEQNVTGELHQPETQVGRFARSIGEFAPNALSPARSAGSALGKLAMKAGSVVAPAVASEGAGQLAHKIAPNSTWAEPVARLVGAVVGGHAMDPRGASRPMRQMRANAPSREAVAQYSNDLYSQLDQAGVRFGQQAYDTFVGRVENLVKNFRPTKAPMASDSLDMLRGWRGKTPTFRDIEDMHQDISSIFRERGASHADRKMASVLMKEFESFYQTAPISVTNPGVVDRANLYQMVRDARDYGRRNILARQIDDMEEAQAGYLGGDESAMRNQFGSVLRSGQRKVLTPAEKDAFRSVVRREGPLNVAHMAGSRLGQAGTIAAGLATAPFTGFLSPVVAAGGFALNLGARKGLEAYTKSAVRSARQTVLAGKKAQAAALAKSALAKGDRMARVAGSAAIGSGQVRGLLSEEPFLTDANGVSYDAKGRIIRK